MHLLAALLLVFVLSGGPVEPAALQAATQAVETLPEIDTSASPNGIVPLPDNVPSVFRDAFAKYTKVVAPSGKPIHILAQDGWSDERILKARNVLEYILTDVPGSRFGAHKGFIADTMADHGATMALFNTESDMREAFRGPLRNVEQGMQDLRANECPYEGEDDYMAHGTRDASFEEIVHLVHDYGIKPALPEMQEVLIRITDDAIERGLWRTRQDDRENEPNEYFAAALDNYLDLWTVSPTIWEGRPIEAGRIPEGTSHFGTYGARGREGMREMDPQGLAILQEFFPPFLTYTPKLPTEFEGTFSIELDPELPYTVKSQHLENVTLSGSNNAGLIGNGWDNHLTGNDGDNVLRGNGGADLLDGGAGTDTAAYRGDSADYTVVRGPNTIRVIDTRVIRDGTDVLLNIERLAFADKTVELH